MPRPRSTIRRADVDVMVASGGIRRRVALNVRPDAGVTAADVAAAVGLAPAPQLWIDGWPFGASHRADELPLRIGAELSGEPPLGGPMGSTIGGCWATHRTGLRPFHRSPRRDLHEPPGPLVLPERRIASGTKPTFSWSAVAVPMVVAIPMMVFFGPRFAMFAAFGPLIAVGSWLEGRRRNRVEQREVARENAAAAQVVDDLVTAAAESFVLARRSRTPVEAALQCAAADADAHLWRRTLDHVDHGTVHFGAGKLWWAPSLATDDGHWPQTRARLLEAPVECTLRPGFIVGVVGDSASGAAFVRWIVAQLVVDHGPSTLRVEVRAREGRRHGWSWASWLPHTDEGPGGTGQSGDSLVVGVIDGIDQLRGRNAGGRSLLHSSAALLVLVDHEDQLPANTHLVVRAQRDGGAVVRSRVADPADEARPHSVQMLGGLSEGAALDLARRLASLDDPDACRLDAGLPSLVALSSILEMPEPTPASMATRWGQARRHTLQVVLGADEHGPVEIDLVADGPHALIGGTTGSGKSELLRSLVCALAANYDPAAVNLVLIDYKGGSAFDVCADLPHVVGVVTDLDEGMAARALRCLRAELHYRESILRSVGAESMLAPEANEAGLARLVVVIDEFATLAADLPDFLDALIGIAQRGRSLGVHLVLATQRPSGSVRADIRANTSIRIALRVADVADSTDIIDAPDALHIDRRFPGRAIVRLGPGETIRLQGAIVTATTPEVGNVAVEAHPVLERESAPNDEPAWRDIDRLVEAAVLAGGDHAPRVPWPAPLCSDITLDDDGSCGRVDEPDDQRQVPLVLSDPLVPVGLFGGDGLALLAVLAGWFSACPSLQVQVIAATSHGEALASVPGVGTVAAVVDAVRVKRLLEVLNARVAASDRSDGPVVLVIDDLDAIVRSDGREHLETIERIAASGARADVGLLVGGAGVASGLVRLQSIFGQRFDLVAGRRGTNAAGDEVVFASVEVGQLIDRSRPGLVPALVIPEAMAHPTSDGLGGPVVVSSSVVRVVVGQSTTTLEPAYLDVVSGGCALVAGPVGEECGALLELLVEQLVDTRPTVVVGGIKAPDDARVERYDDLVDALDQSGPNAVVVVDDVTLLSDATGAIAEALARPGRPALIAGARYGRLRSAFGHWSHEVRSGRSGVLVRPDVLDPELLAAVGRIGADVRLAGRGVVVNDGVMESASLVRPARHRSSGWRAA